MTYILIGVAFMAVLGLIAGVLGIYGWNRDRYLSPVDRGLKCIFDIFAGLFMLALVAAMLYGIGVVVSSVCTDIAQHFLGAV